MGIKEPSKEQDIFIDKIVNERQRAAYERERADRMEANLTAAHNLIGQLQSEKVEHHHFCVYKQTSLEC